MAFLVIVARRLEPFLDQPDIRARCPDSGGRFLLEGVQHVDRLREAHRVHRPVRSCRVVFDDLQHARPQPLPGLGRRRTSAALHHTQGNSDLPGHQAGETEQVLS